jgi:hypothetical protein
MRTSVEGFYAVGDVAGPPLLAHKAFHEGNACIESIHGLPRRAIDYANLPNRGRARMPKRSGRGRVGRTGESKLSRRVDPGRPDARLRLEPASYHRGSPPRHRHEPEGGRARRRVSAAWEEISGRSAPWRCEP